MKNAMKENFNVATVNDGFFKKDFVGEIHDEVIFVQDGSVTLPTGEIVSGKAGEKLVLPVAYNIVVESFSKIIALLVKGDETVFQNMYWEMGSGESSWSNSAPPAPQITDTALVTPLFRKQVNMADVKFIDAEGEYTEEVTNRIEVSVRLLANEANGELREFSIFMGGDSTLGSGYPINRRTHGLIHKTPGIEINRRIHFKF